MVLFLCDQGEVSQQFLLLNRDFLGLLIRPAL